MAIFYGYTDAIYGTQSTVNGSAVNYNYAPPLGGDWRWTGSDTYFVVEENDGAQYFNGDATNEVVSANERVGGTWQQMTNIGGTDVALIWDYTFELIAADGTVYRVGVIDVDLNNDNDLGDASEDGYFLVFPDGMPPVDTDLTVGNIVANSNYILHTDIGASVVCFAAGTLIETKAGSVPVEKLRAGDQVMTQKDGLQPLSWSGQSTVAAQASLAPIVIEKGALGNTRKLVVSPQHAMLISDWRAQLLFGEDEVLVRAIDLVGQPGITQRNGGMVTYCHIMFETHQIVTAEGIPSESFYPGKQAMSVLDKAARDEILTLFPELDSNTNAYGPKAAPYLKSFETNCLRALC